MKRIIIFFLLSNFVIAQEPIDVSLMSVIGNPDAYHGKRIYVQGFAYIEFESHAIYLHSEDVKYGLKKNGIWLSFDPETLNKVKPYSQQYIVVDGIFNKDKLGHMSLNSGTIEKISSINLWKSGTAHRTIHPVFIEK